jgi:hypothetical protein
MDPARRVFLLLSLIISVALITPCVQAHAESIELPLAFDASQVSIERGDEGSRYSLDGAYPLHASGAPELPYFTWKLVLPQGSGIAGAEIVDARWELLDAPQKLSMVDALYTSEGEMAYDTMDGLSDQWQPGESFPAAAVRGQGVALLEGYHIGGVELMPLRVNAAGEVEILVKGRLRVELEDLEVVDPAQREVAWPGVAEAAAQRVRKLVRNPEAVEASAPSPGTPFELLDQGALKTPHPDAGSEVFGGGMIENVIITVPSLVGEFQRLADDHIAHGVPT